MTRRARRTAPTGGHNLAAGGLTQDDVIGIAMTEMKEVLGTALFSVASVQREVQNAIAMSLELGDPKLLAELEAQLKGLAEIEKIKVTKAALRASLSVARAAVNIGIGAAL